MLTNAFPQVWDFANLLHAFEKAARGKRSRPEVCVFEYNLESELLNLQEELQSQTYSPAGYRHFHVHHPKRRLISAAPFRDRVVHHALMNVVEPIFERKFIHDSYACRKGKGTHRALDRCTQFMRHWKYVMHLDIVQFFPSIDHQVLKAELARILQDVQVMELIEKILESGRHSPPEQQVALFPGDDLFALLRPRGLPIGNLTSQHWGNVYLNPIDQFAKRQLKCRGYIRYVDDLLLFSDSKQELWNWKTALVEAISALRLNIHSGSDQPRPVRAGQTFLGFQVFPQYRRLKPANGYAFRRRLNTLQRKVSAGEKTTADLECSVQGWVNHARYGNTVGLRRTLLEAVGGTPI